MKLLSVAWQVREGLLWTGQIVSFLWVDSIWAVSQKMRKITDSKFLSEKKVQKVGWPSAKIIR